MFPSSLVITKFVLNFTIHIFMLRIHSRELSSFGAKLIKVCTRCLPTPLLESPWWVNVLLLIVGIATWVIQLSVLLIKLFMVIVCL